jgi:hypothetical protein
MTTLARIVLGIGIFLVTMLLLAIVEYFSPGSVIWIIEEIDGWYGKILGWLLFITVAALGLTVVWFVGSHLISYLISNLPPGTMDSVRKMALGWATSRPGLIVIGSVIVLSLIALLVLVGWFVWLIW